VLAIPGSPAFPMNPPAFLALVMLISATPLSAQGPVFFADENEAGTFRDLNIRQLVDAADLLARPGVPAGPPPEATGDATFCRPDTLLFCEINTLAPGDPLCAIRREPTIPGNPAEPHPGGLPLDLAPELPELAHGFVVNCANAVPAWQPARTQATPSEVAQIPEPSAVLLLVGAAAWILLRRKL